MPAGPFRAPKHGRSDVGKPAAVAQADPGAVITSGTGLVVWAVCGAVGSHHLLGVAVIGVISATPPASATAATTRPRHALDHLDRPDGRRNHPGVANHVRVCEVDQQESEATLGDTVAEDVGDRLGTHLRREVVGATSAESPPAATPRRHGGARCRHRRSRSRGGTSRSRPRAAATSGTRQHSASTSWATPVDRRWERRTPPRTPSSGRTAAAAGRGPGRTRRTRLDQRPRQLAGAVGPEVEEDRRILGVTPPCAGRRSRPAR